MKKSLVLAMTMALGVSATAFAANPFSDLPAGHWAYASVAKLAAAGVVDGYPDGTFKGDKTMTRYEMAQIVAKALAKGAIGADDKLVGEFADELDNLGVRVAKLEKNADKVKVTGNIRFHYADYSGDTTTPATTRIRSRLFFTGEINDDWHYVSMLQNQQDLRSGDGDSGTAFQRGYLEGRIGNTTKITAGRHNDKFAEGNVYSNRVDGIKIQTGKKLKLTAAYGKMASTDDNTFGVSTTSKSIAGKYWRVGLGGDLGKNFNAEANYVSADDVTDKNGSDDQIYTLGANYVGKNWLLGAMWLHGSSDYTDSLGYGKNGYVISASVGNAKASKQGSLGLWVKYYRQPAATVLSHTMDQEYSRKYGFKGYGIGLDYTVLRNMVLGLRWFDLKDLDANNDFSRKTLWSELVVTF